MLEINRINGKFNVSQTCKKLAEPSYVLKYNAIQSSVEVKIGTELKPISHYGIFLIPTVVSVLYNLKPTD